MINGAECQDARPKVLVQLGVVGLTEKVGLESGPEDTGVGDDPNVAAQCVPESRSRTAEGTGSEVHLRLGGRGLECHRHTGGPGANGRSADLEKVPEIERSGSIVQARLSEN